MIMWEPSDRRERRELKRTGREVLASVRYEKARLENLPHRPKTVHYIAPGVEDATGEFDRIGLWLLVGLCAFGLVLILTL